MDPAVPGAVDPSAQPCLRCQSGRCLHYAAIRPLTKPPRHCPYFFRHALTAASSHPVVASFRPARGGANSYEIVWADPGAHSRDGNEPAWPG